MGNNISKVNFYTSLKKAETQPSGNNISFCNTTDNNGNIYVIGTFEDSIQAYDTNGDPTLIENLSSTQCTYITKFNNIGNALWNIAIDNSGASNNQGLNISCDNNYIYVSGLYLGELNIKNSDGSNSGLTLSVAQSGYYSYYLICYDINGFAIWANKIEATNASPLPEYINFKLVSNTSSVNAFSLYLRGNTFPEGELIIYNNDNSIYKSLIFTEYQFYTVFGSFNNNGSYNWINKLEGAYTGGSPNVFGTININDTTNNLTITGTSSANQIYIYNPSDLNTPIDFIDDTNNNCYIIEYDSLGNYVYKFVIKSTIDTFGYYANNILNDKIYIHGRANKNVSFYNSGDLTPQKTINSNNYIVYLATYNYNSGNPSFDSVIYLTGTIIESTSNSLCILGNGNLICFAVDYKYDIDVYDTDGSLYASPPPQSQRTALLIQYNTISKSLKRLNLVTNLENNVISDYSSMALTKIGDNFNQYIFTTCVLNGNVYNSDGTIGVSPPSGIKTTVNANIIINSINPSYDFVIAQPMTYYNGVQGISIITTNPDYIFSYDISQIRFTETTGIAYGVYTGYHGVVSKVIINCTDSGGGDIVTNFITPITVVFTFENGDQSHDLLLYKIDEFTGLIMDPQPTGYPLKVTTNNDGTWNCVLPSLSSYYIIDPDAPTGPAGGDPHITTIYGQKYTLPNWGGVNLLTIGKLKINASCRLLHPSEIPKLHYLTRSNKIVKSYNDDIRNITYFDKLVIQKGNDKFIMDFDSQEIIYNNYSDHLGISKTQSENGLSLILKNRILPKSNLYLEKTIDLDECTINIKTDNFWDEKHNLTIKIKDFTKVLSGAMVEQSNKNKITFK